MKTHAIKWITLACVLLIAGCSGSSTVGSHQSPTITAPGVGTVSARISGLGALSDSRYTYGIAADDTAVWVYNGVSGNVVRIDPKTNRVVATIYVGVGCTLGVLCGNVAIGQGAVWVASGASGTVSRIDPATNQVVATLNFGTAVGVSPGTVWVADYQYSSLTRVDPATNRPLFVLGSQPGASAVSFSAGALWLCNVHGESNGLVRIDPATNKVQAQLDVSLNQGLECFDVVAVDQSVWVDASDGTTTELERIAPATNTIGSSAQVPGGVFAANEQGVWGLDPAGLIRFDPQTAQIVGHLALTDVAGIGVGAGSVWVAQNDGTLLRVAPAS